MITELKRLNTVEREVIIRALRLFADSESSAAWAAEALLEDDAKFIHSLFWSKEEK